MPRSNFTPDRGVLALLPILALTGSATQQSVGEQTDALHYRLANIEGELGETRSMATTAPGQATTAQRQIQALPSGLSARLHPLEARLGVLEERQLTQAAALGKAHQQLTQEIAAAKEALGQAKAATWENGDQSTQGRRLAETEARAGQAAALGQNAMNQAMQAVRASKARPSSA